MDGARRKSSANDLDLKKRGALGPLFEWVEAVVTAIIVIVLVFTFVFRVVSVSGPSMEDTIQNNDKVILTNFNYQPKNGDIVVVTHAKDFNEPIIKRVIAVEGQTIKIDFSTGNVFVDGQLLNEPYIKNKTINSEGGKIPDVIPAGYVFVMGDNRQNSKDSRSSQIGIIDKKTILGKAEFVVFPFDRIGDLYK
jgi:signal peptidase I